jgi:hypothetical protein
MKHKYALCRQNVLCLDVKPGGTQSNYWAINGESLCLQGLCSSEEGK